MRNWGSSASGAPAGWCWRVIESTGRDVAVKYLASWLVDSPERLADFRTEAELMAGLVDDNLVTLYEYVETDAGAAIAMELVEGVALRAILEKDGPLTPEASLTLMKGSLRGLAALHRQGVVHRDYKPENVMVDGAGATKLVDYGIAAPVGELAGIAGTPLYMAPEQWAGEPSTAASDVYAASATFVESLTGHPVFNATTVDGLRSQHFSSDPSLEGVPAEVRGIAKAGLAKDPAERITDAEALVEQLEVVAGDTYGPDWEERGRRHLAARAALLALLFPHARLKVTQHASALTVLGTLGLLGGTAPAQPGGRRQVETCRHLRVDPRRGCRGRCRGAFCRRHLDVGCGRHPTARAHRARGRHAVTDSDAYAAADGEPAKATPQIGRSTPVHPAPVAFRRSRSDPYPCPAPGDQPRKPPGDRRARDDPACTSG